jgi:secreted trypsin-like serine protease
MDRLNHLLAVLSISLAAVGCQSESEPRGDSTATTIPIIDGTYDFGDPAVVSLTSGNGFSFCTGTLISSRVVLTAGHCVQGAEPAGVRIYFGERPSNGGALRPVTDVYSHPDYRSEQPGGRRRDRRPAGAAGRDRAAPLFEHAARRR